MRKACGVILSALLPVAVCAQDVNEPIIPMLVAPSLESSQISVVVDRGLTSNRSVRSRAMRNARIAMHNGDPVAPETLRRLAELGDGLAALRYVRILLAAEEPAPPSDIAYYAAISVGTGRVWTLKQMIDAMHRLDPKTEPPARVRKYIRVLYPHAWAGNALALDALVAFNGEGRLFGPLSDATRARILEQARVIGDGRTELGLALGILETEGVKPDPDETELERARTYLGLAQDASHLGVRTTAQNLLRLMENS